MSKLALCFFASLLAAFSGEPGITEIMSRVAENQTRSLEARKQWVYEQEVLTRLTRTNGKLAREERKTYFIVPTAKGFEKKLVNIRGKYEHKGVVSEYTEAPKEEREFDIDGDLASGLTEDILSDPDARDGISPGMFPLAEKEQYKYDYKLVGRETYRGRPVIRISFRPKAGISDNANWKGELLVDEEEHQPVLITTNMAHRVPVVVRTLLGTNVKNLGFSISYQRVGEGVWFPVSWGGEFKIRAVFFYARNISLSMKNSGFRQTNVESRVIDEEPVAVDTASP